MTLKTETPNQANIIKEKITFTTYMVYIYIYIYIYI